MNQSNKNRNKNIFSRLLAAFTVSMLVTGMNGVPITAEETGTEETTVETTEENQTETEQAVDSQEVSEEETDTEDTAAADETVTEETEETETDNQDTETAEETEIDTSTAEEDQEEETETETPEEIQDTEDTEDTAIDSVDVEEEQADTSELEVTLTAIYLNGKSGDDGADGSSADQAVKTFARAKELALADSNIETIYVMGSVTISGEMSLEGTNAVIKRDPSFSDYLLVINRGDSAVLKNITIDGNSEETTVTKKSLIYDRGSLTIEDGAVLTNNKLTDLGYFHATGGAVRVEEGTLVMTGGLIEDNLANYGGGVYLNYHAVMTMPGGVIQSNYAKDGTESGLYGYAAGGGIALYGGATLNLSGDAQIINNTSDHMGGGISLGTGVASNGSDVLNMTGGSVSGNTSGSGGGGIMVQAGKANSYAVANISGGSITNNTMTGNGEGEHAFGGGGIYVNGYADDSNFHNGILNLSNALITENTAAEEGGGYAACPVSSTDMYLEDGSAIFNNSGSRANDIYILASAGYGDHSGNLYYTVSSTMLGGTPYHWKDDYGNELPLNRLKGQLIWYSYDNYELTLTTDVKDDAAARAYAKVIISGNTSAIKGGGIGSNGTVNIGRSDTRDITVTKTWETKKTLPESITVDLMRTSAGSDEAVRIGSETITPDADGGWNLTFTNLPEKDNAGNLYEYTVKEEPLAGYVSTVEGNMDVGFTITNRDRIEQKILKITGSLTLTKISNGKETPANAVFTITGPNNYEKVIR